MSDDPEFRYRSGFQHGAWAVYSALEGKLSEADRKRVREWIEIDVQNWRHNPAKNRKPEITLA